MISCTPLKVLAFALAQAGSVFAGDYYAGFEKMKHLFVFGASLDSTDLPGTAVTGVTTAYGPNIPRYLTSDFDKIRLGPNQVSNMVLHNYASPGATTNTSVIPTSNQQIGPYTYTPRDWSSQIGTYFWSDWTRNGKAYGWSSSDSLFIITASNVGNDVFNGFQYSDRDDRRTNTIRTIVNRINQLYDAGARNFIWLEVPPTEIVPRFSGDSAKQASLKAYGDAFQADLNYIKNAFIGIKPNVTFWQPKTRQQTRDIQSNPGQFGYTGGYKETRNYCSWLENQGYTPNPDADNDGRNVCPNNWVAKEWMWHDQVHYTFPTHRVLATTTWICLMNVNGC